MSRTRIKFCGFTRAGDIAQAVELGVDFVGLIFAPRSPRRLDVQQARRLREAVPEEIGVVALVMDQDVDAVRAIVDQVRPDLLQFHGSEDEAFCTGFGLPYWKAIPMGGDPQTALARLRDYPAAQGFVFDGHAAGESGGSGQRFDWTLLPSALERPVEQHVLLAGGLDAGNVARAVRAARPWAVDVSSGIESAPGIKSAERMRAFIDGVAAADVIP
ncbi:N-(5'-phosphoribosyl)anthranilate isomerase [Pseudoxanthomonas kalamensis DSM 18571]|uniref:phosphoribosylanthranilate isomerase n=1 Tax=Pseudoxanthomonas kalamensis TaxID=289483 RepID=UPI001390CB2B|nr:phosphoribosylanthranilate isomerase [Pseudoxanthomonas kalamensis]KAF1709952.1 N-(5'-phosphoribosyl)anthranilate isomerase [Pseudoxanthomonas kalamensis DSM 18571]